MEERIKFNVSRSISRQSIFPTLKREDRIKKMKAHLAKFNQDEKNIDLGYLQMSPHTTQVLYSLSNKNKMLMEQKKTKSCAWFLDYFGFNEGFREIRNESCATIRHIFIF